MRGVFLLTYFTWGTRSSVYFLLSELVGFYRPPWHHARYIRSTRRCRGLCDSWCTGRRHANVLRRLIKHRQTQLIDVINLIIIPVKSILMLIKHLTVIVSDDRSNRQVRRQQTLHVLSSSGCYIWLVETVRVIVVAGSCYGH